MSLDKWLVKRNKSAADSSPTLPLSIPDQIDKESELIDRIKWQEIRATQLNLHFAGSIFSPNLKKVIFSELEEQVQYYGPESEMSRVRVYNKWHPIPRKQAAYGDDGLKYSFSGIQVTAKPWTPLLDSLRNYISQIASHRLGHNVTFNFVLVNRYKDGLDHMGEHRDDEKELDPDAPIASLSLGAERDFIFKHGLSRGKNAPRKDIKSETIPLPSGSLLLMLPPTNSHWYHSLPVRRRSNGVRVNLTFRKMV